MRNSAQTKSIIVALWLGNASGRDLLTGIFRYAREAHLWRITLLSLPDGVSAALVNEIRDIGADGIITSDPEDTDVRSLARTLDCPVVVIGPPEGLPRAPGGKTVSIDRDDTGVGQMGARHFLSAGRFNSYGFVQQVDRYPLTSSGRENGFRQALAAVGKDCRSFSAFEMPNVRDDTQRLKLWLKQLPKPAAVMCFYDSPAVQVMNACLELGITVPEQVSILGVDNDELVCETAPISLSSIQPDHETMGYAAARQLDSLISGARRPLHKVHLVHRLVERDSTRQMRPSTGLVQRALDYINHEAVRGIGVQDVVNHLGVSRRLADLRFREIENRSIHDAIERRRLDVAVQKLRQSSWPIARIVSTCGYATRQAFDAAFRKRFGQTAGRYRKKLASAVRSNEGNSRP